MAAAAAGDGARRLVLAGWAAKGVVYLGLAWLVLQLARGGGGGGEQEASTRGALALVESTGSSLLLAVLGVGLLLYAGGRILEVTVLARGEVDGKDRVQAVVMSLVYLALAGTAFTVATRGGSEGGSGGASGGGRAQQGTAVLLGLPAGRLLVAAVGIGLFALAVHSAAGGLERRFLPTLRTGEMAGGTRALVERIGVAAMLGRGAVFAVVGWFVVQAAVTYDAGEAVGLDGSLSRVAEAGWGRALLLAISVGLLAYAAFCAIQARFRLVGVSAGSLA